MDFPSGQAIDASSLVRDETIDCDAVVVGTGAGGAAAAFALSNLGLKVAMVEEGLRWDPQALVPKSSWAQRHLYAERSARFMTGSTFAPLPGGRAVGGSTLINSAICFRAGDAVLSRWRSEHGIDWADPQWLAPLYREVESTLGVQKTAPWAARKNNLLFKDGCEKLGIPGDFISRSAPACVGCGVCQLGCPTGGKASVDRNFVPAALRGGAALFTSSRAKAVTVRGGAAVGIEAQVLDPSTDAVRSRLTVRAPKVFLAGGAIGTPVLLLRQGLANSSGQVGRNLRVHPSLPLAARFEQVVDAWDGVPQGYYADLGDVLLEAFAVTPDLYFTQFPELVTSPEIVRHLGGAGGMVGDESSGTVRPKSDASRADIRYELNEVDKKRLLRGVREAGRIYFAAGALEAHVGIHGLAVWRSAEELSRAVHDALPVEDLPLYASHPQGTCRMSSDPARGVVKPTGETHDVQNLYVVDGSVFPTALGVNPQITIMALALAFSRWAAKAG